MRTQISYHPRGQKLDRVVDKKRMPAPQQLTKNRPFWMMAEGESVIIDIEEFQYAYRCKH
ncbi:hypothetical protein AUF78_17020 [archaeon 13_1_20CM_2_51_12]|nr:MAG: hypothetical protein AUF78_17020 [archaeon 13_1_20CM_2_51_12]